MVYSNNLMALLQIGNYLRQVTVLVVKERIFCGKVNYFRCLPCKTIVLSILSMHFSFLKGIGVCVTRSDP